jgi:hypothetical protein
MSKAIELLAARPIGAHPITVGTSHAIESIVDGNNQAYDPQRKIIKVDLSAFDEYWINVFTIARNIIQSVPSKDLIHIDCAGVEHILKREVDYIKSVISPLKPVVFYYCEYNNLGRIHKNANFKNDNTEKSKMFSNLIMDSLSAFIKNENKESDNIKVFSNELGGFSNKNVLITTSHAYDLISAKCFNDCTLLESNTGALKKKPLWYTKLAYGNKNPRLPLNNITIQIYGDSQMFRPIEKYLRDAVDSIAETFEWTYMTTVDRMRYSLSRLDFAIKAPILDLF